MKKLKKIPAGNKGLPKLPKKIRNKMGYFVNGGKAEQKKDGKIAKGCGKLCLIGVNLQLKDRRLICQSKKQKLIQNCKQGWMLK